jgi:glucokinase
MFLGIEIGGTKLQLGLGEGDGHIVALKRHEVRPAAGAAAILDQIQEAVPPLLAQAGLNRTDLKGVGIGFGGPVDDATRCVLKSHHVEGWSGFPLAGWAERQLGVPAVLGNDADVAGLAEARFGAGRGCSPLFYVTVGSGIGGSILLDGRIHRGCGKGAGEIGHFWARTDIMDFNPAATPDRWRIVEHCASGWAIARHGKQPSAEEVVASARAGDAAAADVLQRSRRHLAIALSQVIALICPRRIVIGGGVSLMGDDLFFQPLRDEVAQIVFKPFASCYDIVPAELGEAVVVHGALALARQT